MQGVSGSYWGHISEQNKLSPGLNAKRCRSLYCHSFERRRILANLSNPSLITEDYLAEA